MEIKIIKDSISNEGVRITTFHCRYWRPIHAELMTHRVFSRNARSSRAVPVMTLLNEEIFIPEFTKNQKGMQGDGLLSPEDQERARTIWVELAEHTRREVAKLHELNVHKQHCNRPLEWFGWIDVLITSTWWKNFWELRIHKAAQPELWELAKEMRSCMELSMPRLLQPGQWHLPFVSEAELITNDWPDLLRMSTARCARISYKPFDGQGDFEAESARHDILVVERPVHASPAEHQATPDRKVGETLNDKIVWQRPDLHGNFYGWNQYRKMLPAEAVMEEY